MDKCYARMTMQFPLEPQKLRWQRATGKTKWGKITWRVGRDTRGALVGSQRREWSRPCHRM